MKKRITFLHANDIHGQLHFKASKDFTIHGGISLLSGYVKKVRMEGPTFFGICGDMLQEDIWGSDYKGTNTVELINYISPDLISLGNHELDYGLAHLLVFKACIHTLILCANIEVTQFHEMLFLPSLVKDIGGVKVLFIGVIPLPFFKKVLSDEFFRHMLTYRETYDAIRTEIAVHQNEHIDLVVLMSHYGIEGDRVLAQEMPEDIHIDLILGGHSHIEMDEAEVVNGIPIAQSSYGTTHIGRFELEVDTEKGGLSDWSWRRVELTEAESDFDLGVDELADKIVFHTKPKRENAFICQFEKTFGNHSRLFETELGDLVSDCFAQIYGTELVILQSGSLRRNECGPKVLEKELRELYPFDDRFVTVMLTGREIKDGFDYLFSLKPDGSCMNGTFQYSKGFRLRADAEDYHHKGCRVLELTLNGKEFEDDRKYRVGLTLNCADNFPRYFGFVIAKERRRTVSLSTFGDLSGFLIRYPKVISPPEMGRFFLDNFEG
ncbi:MAG: bifunctional metallophosphatase/5'-nucleotidase [Victivallales bacterium]|nr:bifunctional metallophosphatase/5'-nucleotidase [Victivallales bacterium]